MPLFLLDSVCIVLSMVAAYQVRFRLMEYRAAFSPALYYRLGLIAVLTWGIIFAFYKLYHNQKTDQLLAEIAGDQLKQNVMVSRSIHAGPGVAGWMWGDSVVRWERRNKQLLLIQPDLRNEGKEGKAVSDAVRRTYTDRIVRTVNIKTLHKGNAVIDLGDLFNNPVHMQRAYKRKICPMPRE